MANDVFLGSNVRIDVAITPDGAAPTSWFGTGVNLVGIATSFSCSAKGDKRNITGLNRKEPYAVRVGALEYEWSIKQLVSTGNWVRCGADGALITGSGMHPGNLSKQSYKFAMRVTGLKIDGDTVTSQAAYDTNKLVTMILTGCTISGDSFSVDGSDGEFELTLDGGCAAREVTIN